MKRYIVCTDEFKFTSKLLNVEFLMLCAIHIQIWRTTGAGARRPTSKVQAAVERL